MSLRHDAPAAARTVCQTLLFSTILDQTDAYPIYFSFQLKIL